MSQEIIYTSAPKGLKAGSRGFCTVASTSGMAVNLAERLESLSGYRHAYLPHEEKAYLNPVNFSHQTITVGGRKYHVLSRICNAGLDYTQRSNKLAHHVALDQREATAAPGGPAWVLKDDNFCVTQWSGDPRQLPTGRTPRSDDCPQGKCVTWEKVTGDAGWAGVLAESLDKNAGRPMSIIFKPGIDTLQLLVEAIALLPPEKRWNVTFSTYCTNSASDAQWRFLLEGTDEATKIQRNPHTPKIDLTQNLGRAEGGELVELARRGGARPSLARPSAGNRIARRVAPGSKPQAPGFADASELTEIPAPPSESGRPAAPGGRTSTGLSEPPIQDPLGIGLSKPKKSPARLILFGAVAAVLIVGLLVGAFMMGQGSNNADRSDEIVKKALADKKKQEEAEAGKVDQKQNDQDNAIRNASTNQNSNPDQQLVKASSSNGNVQEDQPPAYQPPSLQQPSDQTVVAGSQLSLKITAKKGAGNGNLRYALLPPSPKDAAIDPDTGKLTWKPQSDDFAKDHDFTVQVVDESRPAQAIDKTFKVTVSVPDPFVDIRNLNRTLDLPAPNRSGIQGTNDLTKLARLFVKPENLRLDLLAMEQSQQDGFDVKFKRDGGNAPKWTLWQTRKKKSGPTFAPAVGGNEAKPVATFELKDQFLMFQWEKERPAVSLSACLLHIMADGKTETCVLTKPKETKPIRIDFAGDSETAEAGISNLVDMDIQDKDLPNRETLRLKLQLDGFPANSFKGEPLKVNQPVNVRFGTWKEKVPIVELVVLLRWRENDPKPSLVIKPLAFPTILSSDGKQTAILPLPLTGDPKLARRKRDDGFVNPTYLKEECEKHLEDVEKRGSAYKEAIAGFNQQLKPVVDRLAVIDGVAKKLTNLKNQYKAEKKQKEKDKLNDRINSTNLELQQLKKEVPGLLKQKQDIEKKLAEKWTFLNQGKIAGENLKYAQQLSQVMEGIKKGVVHFQAYFDVDGKIAKKQVVVVETAKSPTGS